jgi:hypothetical protein
MGRFLTRDTWSGDANSPLSLNKWSYVEANPVNRVDPSGRTSLIPLVNFRTGEISYPNDPNAPQWEYREKAAVYRAVFDVASAYAKAYNQEMLRRSREDCGPELYLWVMPQKMSPYEAFLRIHGGSFNVWRLARTSEQFFNSPGSNVWGYSIDKNNIYIFRNASTDDIATRPRFFIHEIGHSFEKAIYSKSGFWIRSEMQAGTAYWDDSMYWRVPGNGGFYGSFLDWQFSRDAGPYEVHNPDNPNDDTDGRGEIFADMFIGWVYSKWEDSDLGDMRSNFMNYHMPIWIANAIGE